MAVCVQEPGVELTLETTGPTLLAKMEMVKSSVMLKSMTVTAPAAAAASLAAVAAAAAALVAATAAGAA